ncbi:MAG: hypothetical protein KJ720_04605 [Proteobacteria bacterium]|nr:hypothetical protein [Pseudomonadota bacterium]MBU1452137.1 hypothetical protein [Pseudomonadota bacterium]MBU2467532.1 hypothetical protein [Pseudomonadota bacterium]MBU2517937.1 hypothetical protein [Pseudomonadota bacterium]
MPLFSFFCNRCGQEVELFLSLGELNRGVAACPICKGKDLQGPMPEKAADAPAGSSCSLSKKS